MEAFVIPSTLVCLIVFLWCWFYWWPQRRSWELAKKIPGPKGYPVLGNCLLLKGKMGETLPAFLKLYNEYGPVVRLWMGPCLYVLLKDPDDIQVILRDPKIWNRDRLTTKAMEPFLGNGLFSNRDEEWKIHRKIITPTFHVKILESYVEVFGRKSLILMKKLEEFEGRIFDAYNILALCTLDAICETAIGTVVDSQTVGQSDLVDCLDAFTPLIHRRGVEPWLSIDFIYALSSDGRRSKPVIKATHEFSESVIAQKLDEFRRGVRSPGITTAGNKRVSSFLDMLIEASETQGSILTPEEMRDEVTTLAVAGFETTASTMSFLLVLIALNPEIQAEVHRELDDVFGSDSRPATSEDMHQLPVMERCIKEALRMFPVVTLIPREIGEEVVLPSGYTLPAGCSTMIISYATHRDPRYFPEPDKFWPDRWLPENKQKTHPYAYLPFSAGPRNCVGQKYAQLQMKNILSQVLRRYRVTTPLSMSDLQRLELALTLVLDRALGERYRIQLHRREESQNYFDDFEKSPKT